MFRIQSGQGRLEDAGEFPSVVLIDTVSLCNLRCSMCVHKDMTRPKGVMPWSLFTRIIDEIAVENIHARVWMVFFGEALILKRTKPSIFDMIAYAKGKGLADVVINTNANLMDEEAADSLLRSGIDAVYVGLDSCSQGTYAGIRVGGDYHVVVNNILNLMKMKKERGLTRPGIFVQFVEMEQNAHEKEDFIRFWEKHEVTVKIRPKVSWAGNIDAPNLILGNDKRWPCHWAMQSMSITDRGKVVTCAVDLDARYIAGDVNERTLKDIWNDELRALRLKHLARKFGELPDVCRDCRDWQSARADYYSGPSGRTKQGRDTKRDDPGGGRG